MIKEVMVIRLLLFIQLCHLCLINCETLHVNDDSYYEELGVLYRDMQAKSGKEYKLPSKFSRLEVLSNDIMTTEYDACAEKLSTNHVTPGNKTKHFENVAEMAGINHEHRYTVPTRSMCLFDVVILGGGGNGTNSRVSREMCTLEMLTSGAAVGDYDGDGLDDLYFTVAFGPSKLYKNNGDGTYTDVSKYVDIGPSKYANGAAWGDVDSDGDLDLYVTTIGDTRHYLYINNGGYFTEQAMERSASLQFPNKRKLSGTTPTFGDFDLDGYLDIYVGEWNYYYLMENVSASRLLRNLGPSKPGYFVDVTDSAGVNMDSKWQTFRNMYGYGTHVFGGSFIDFNDDRYPDLFLAADFGQSLLFLNNKDGTFKECKQACGILGFQDAMGLTIGDLNRDGKQDIFVSAIHYTKSTCKISSCKFGEVGNAYYENVNGTFFVNKAKQYGIENSYWGWGASFMDFNNDGNLDLAVTNGFDSTSTAMDDYYANRNSQLFENKGTGPLKDVAYESGMDFKGQGRGLVVSDFDDDGDEDIIITSLVGRPLLYRNNMGNNNNWLKVLAMEKCANDAGKLCTSLGAKVVLTTTSGRKQYSYIGSKSHFNGQGEQVAHFGLGEENENVNVEIYWPRTDRRVYLENVPVNHKIKAIQPTMLSETRFAEIKLCPKVYLKEITVQPDIGTVMINTDRMTLSYSTEKKILFNIGKQTFSYVAALSSNDSIMGTGHVVIDDRVSPDLYFPCKDGRQVIPGEQRVSTEDRRLDGVSNNQDKIHWGSVNEDLLRITGHAYGDNVSEPAGACTPKEKLERTCRFPTELSGLGSNRPSARAISNTLMKQTMSKFSARNMSDLTMHFGQYIAHDLDHTSMLPRFEHQYYKNHVWMPISVPKGDLHFDPYSSGKEYIPFVRSTFNRCTGMYPSNIPRQQPNVITAIIDANMVYGSSLSRCSHLREYSKGLMKLGPNLLLPKNNKFQANENPMARPSDELYLAGDVRANVQPGLTAIHTLFVREHNRLAREYHLKNPMASDEEIFQYARRIVIAETQAITYEEYLPAILGRKDFIPPYSGYKKDVNPGISTEFSTAAFRFGHSEVNSHVFRVSENGQPYHNGHLLLREAYFRPNLLENDGGLDPILRGFLHFRTQDIDLHMVDEMRNALFPTAAATPGKVSGFDLASINIQRGRDHGLPDFNTVRKRMGLRVYKNFEEITSNREVSRKMKELYGSIEHIDLWVGGLAEDHLEGSELGETFHKILVEQFIRLRDGDRFWYEHIMTEEEIKKVKSLTFSKIIKLNSNFKECPENVFFSKSHCSGTENHQCVPISSHNHFESLRDENTRLKDENDDQDSTIRVLIIVVCVLGLACLICLLFAIGIAFFKKNNKELEMQNETYKERAKARKNSNTSSVASSENNWTAVINISKRNPALELDS